MPVPAEEESFSKTSLIQEEYIHNTQSQHEGAADALSKKMGVNAADKLQQGYFELLSPPPKA